MTSYLTVLQKDLVGYSGPSAKEEPRVLSFLQKNKKNKKQ